MKKQVRKINLNRETLHTLENADLKAAAAGLRTYPPVCETSTNC